MRLPKKQLGIPITKEVYHCFSEDEKKFWDDFHEIAKEEVRVANERGDHNPFIPSLEFKKKYQEAIEKYNGGNYCHVRQLEMMFDFSVVVH